MTATTVARVARSGHPILDAGGVDAGGVDAGDLDAGGVDAGDLGRALRGRAQEAIGSELDRLTRRRPELEPEQREAIQDALWRIAERLVPHPAGAGGLGLLSRLWDLEPSESGATRRR